MIKVEPIRSDAGQVASGFALWDLGFRPFYLLAGIFAASSILLWIGQYAGYLSAAYLQGPAWHGHEMIFGYAMAVVAGFLLTAVRNWTGKPTPAGVALMAIAALWIAGRILVLTPYAVAAAIANAGFPITLAVGIGRAVVQSRNRRNYFFLALLLLLGLATLAFHLSQLGVLQAPANASLYFGLDVILFIVAVISGRVVPMFTNNGVPGAGATRHPLVEKAALAGVVAMLAVDLFPVSPWVAAALAFGVAAAHAVRLYLWRPWGTRSVALVWILHVSYGWIVIYLALRGLADIGVVGRQFAVHALTIGAIGGMTIGMMTRTARGHTGRQLVADRFDTSCYVMVSTAAAIRVFGGMWLPDAYLATVLVSGACWSAAFALFVIRYWPVLSRSRVDGNPG